MNPAIDIILIMMEGTAAMRNSKILTTTTLRLLKNIPACCSKIHFCKMKENIFISP